MSATPAPTFATAITLARATWGKTALVRLASPSVEGGAVG